MSIATLSSKYQISIPKEVCKAMGFRPGQKLVFLRVGPTLKLLPQTNIAELFGIARGANGENYRDRGSRRAESLPRMHKAPKAT
jgi:AbrB family looped-hinge helix DNA binding protein